MCGDCATSGYCGDQVCARWPGSEWENAASCPDDCTAACGDGFCDASESPATCPYDCLPVAGDGICSQHILFTNTKGTFPFRVERLSALPFNVPQYDVPSLTTDCVAVCGDRFCAGPPTGLPGPETRLSCPEDCRPVDGDGICQYPWESYYSTGSYHPKDCQTPPF